MGGIGLSVRFDQAKHGVAPGNRWLRRDGDGLRDVVRSVRGEGKAAGADNAANCGNSEEPSSRRIYGRVCGWRVYTRSAWVIGFSVLYGSG